ncbi:PRA1 family protein G2-like [Lycium ferocissimum]|uniref:PRA1 family protein G2-like n=1 Tax=Lycium ferocissimum TaxID=112874 RepID=UPI002814A26B|nr:PRA1 family protein G2-like [Lycium ferocissimum]
MPWDMSSSNQKNTSYTICMSILSIWQLVKYLNLLDKINKLLKPICISYNRMWLILLFFREDPMVVLGHQVSDLVVITGFVVVSVIAVWFTGILNKLMIGLGIGVLVSVIHGGLRNPEGLFVDEDDAVSTGLISNGERA